MLEIEVKASESNQLLIGDFFLCVLDDHYFSYCSQPVIQSVKVFCNIYTVIISIMCSSSLFSSLHHFSLTSDDNFLLVPFVWVHLKCWVNIVFSISLSLLPEFQEHQELNHCERHHRSYSLSSWRWCLIKHLVHHHDVFTKNEERVCVGSVGRRVVKIVYTRFSQSAVSSLVTEP